MQRILEFKRQCTTLERAIQRVLIFKKVLKLDESVLIWEILEMFKKILKSL